MTPVIVLVGRPNVGKSTLFNRLTKTREALVVDLPGVTRDRQYGQATWQERPYIVVDTGGIVGDEVVQGIDESTRKQAQQAINEADAILFLVDGRGGMTAADEEIAQQLRQVKKPITLVVNKTDGLDALVAASEFYALGFGELTTISASHGHAVSKLEEKVLQGFFEHEDEELETEVEKEDQGIKIAFVGKPNVGKSTLVNRLLGEERVIVYDQPGTTRDTIAIPFERQNKRYTLIDTAGIRRKSRIDETVEKFSVIKSLKAIEESHVVIAVIDAKEKEIAEQDLRLIGHALQAGRAIVIAVNKWDGMQQVDKDWVKRELKRRLVFLDHVKIHFISALHGSGVGDLYPSIDKAYENASKELTSAKLTRILEKAVEQHQPPLVQGRRIKLLFAHPGGVFPPTIIIHGRQTDSLSEPYRRYLVNFYRKELDLAGTAIKIKFVSSENPFKDQRNRPTESQERSRRRLHKIKKKK